METWKYFWIGVRTKTDGALQLSCDLLYCFFSNFWGLSHYKSVVGYIYYVSFNVLIIGIITMIFLQRRVDAVAQIVG